MTTEQMDWLDDERAGRHKPPFNPQTAFAVTDRALVDAPDLGRLFEKVAQELRDEDARMRSEVLPQAPAGWEWVAELVSERWPDGVLGEVRVRLSYRLEAVR